MRKLLSGAIVASTSLALAGGAVAQVSNSDTTLDVSVSPAKAGTKKKPRNVRLRFRQTVNKPGTTVQTIEVRLPKGLAFSGKGFAKCNAESLVATGSCPGGSKAGPRGTASAYVEPSGPALNFTVTPYVEDANTFLFYLVEPGGIQTVVKGEVSGKGRRMVITIPVQLRQPLAGLDATLTGLDQVFAGKRGKRYIVSSTGCKRTWAVTGGLTFATRANGTPGPAPESLTEKVPCRR